MEIQEQAKALYRGESLAPMVRASTTPLRTLALHYGADFTYTEELVDRSIAETMRVENESLGTIDYVKDTSKLSKKTQRKLKRDNNRPCLILRIDKKLETERNNLVCQLGTGEPELALPAAKHVYKDVAAIDINMGCPKKFSVSGGMGSALLKDPERAARIVKTLRAEIPRPISVKIRLLPSIQQTVDFCHTMINAGANAVAIHARKSGTDSTVNADWGGLKEVLGLLRPKYPDFPFLVNGDFYEREERKQFLDETKIDGFLLGRPALYNTSTFLPMKSPLVDKTNVIQEYIRQAMRYEVHYKNAKYVICEMMNNRRAPTDRVPYLPQVYKGGQTIAKTCNSKDYKDICQVWNVQWSSSANLVKEMAAAGEHRYEDSYFLKRDKASSSTGDDTSSTTENGNAAKRSRVEVPASANANAKDGEKVKVTPKEEEEAAADGGSKTRCTIH
mmetsp:Transcript_5909/g.14016  ORF Transcript_5909/g.14016 Transcript_5909/m.14016 type:complete len:447 (+) Transcript_5909:61-1401(+)